MLRIAKLLAERARIRHEIDGVLGRTLCWLALYPKYL